MTGCSHTGHGFASYQVDPQRPGFVGQSGFLQGSAGRLKGGGCGDGGRICCGKRMGGFVALIPAGQVGG